MAHLLHVYPVRDNAKREGLRKLFSRCGFVVGVDKIGRGGALVGYREKAEAEQAMKTLNFTAFEGRVLQIKKSILFTEEHFASVREPNYGFCLRQFLCLDFNIYECINAVAGGQCLRGKHFCFHCLLQGLGHLPHRNRDDNCPSRQRGWEDKTQYKSAEERLGIPQAHSQQPRRTTSPSQALTAAPVEVPAAPAVALRAAAQNSQQPVGSNPSRDTSPTDTAAPAVALPAAAQNSQQSLGNNLRLDTSAAQNDPEDKLTYILFNDAKGWKPGYHDDVNALLQEQQHKPHVDVPRGSIVLLDNPNNDFDPARAVNVSVVDQPGVKVTALLNQMQAVSEEIVNLLRPAKYETRYQLITDSRRVPSLSCRLGEMVHFTPPGETNPIQAVVRYMGPVHTLGPGTRIGLQIMDEDRDFGDTNGTLGGRVYFEADENKGVFCHVGQITRIQKNEELTKMSQSVSVGRLVNEFNSYDSTKDQGNKRHNLTLSNNRHRNNFAETRQEQVRSTSSKTVDELGDRRQSNMETLKNVISQKRKATSLDVVGGTAKVIKPSTSKGFYLAPHIYNQLSDVEKRMSNVLCGPTKKRQVEESEERPDMARSFASRIMSNGPVVSKKLQVNNKVADLIMGCIPAIEFNTKTNVKYVASAAFPNTMYVYIRGIEKDVKNARKLLEESARLYTQ